MANSSSFTFPTSHAHSQTSSSTSFPVSESATDSWVLDTQSVPLGDCWDDCFPPNHASPSSSQPNSSSSIGQSGPQVRRGALARTTTAVHETSAVICRADANLVEIYASAIGRVVRKSDDKPLGTCFLIAPATVMTCFHVIPNAALPGDCKAQFFGRTTTEQSSGLMRRVVCFKEIDFDPDGSKMICCPREL